MSSMKEYVEKGLRCPKCRGRRIRSCDLGDSIFAEYDHFVCEDCGLRWTFAHRMRDEDNNDELIARIRDKYIWVLYELKMEVVK